MDKRELDSSSSDIVRTMEEAVPEQRIRERAYEIYLQRGAKGGHADGDWLTAEAELKEIKKKAAHIARIADSLTR